MLLVTLLVRDDEGNGAKSAGEKHSFLPLRCLEVGPWFLAKGLIQYKYIKYGTNDLVPHQYSHLMKMLLINQVFIMMFQKRRR